MTCRRSWYQFWTAHRWAPTGVCSVCQAAAPRCRMTSGTFIGFRCDRLAGHDPPHSAVTSRTMTNGRETDVTYTVWSAAGVVSLDDYWGDDKQ